MAVNNCGYVCALPPQPLPRLLGHPDTPFQPLHLGVGVGWVSVGHGSSEGPCVPPQAAGWTPSLLPCVQVLDPLLEVPECAGEGCGQHLL